MILQTQEKGARSETEDVIGGDVAVFPGDGFDVGEDGVAFLAGGDDYAAGACALGEGLGFWLGYACPGSCGCCGWIIGSAGSCPGWSACIVVHLALS